MKSKIFLFLTTLVLLPHCLTSQQRVLDRIVAVVDKDVILESELNQQIDFFVFNNQIEKETPNLKQVVLDALINDKLIVAKALEDTNISVTEDDVTQRLDGVIQQGVQQFGSEKKLEEYYGMPVTKIKREWRDEMRRKLLSENMQKLKFGSITINRREVEEFFQTYKDSLPDVPESLELYHILKLPAKSGKLIEQAKNTAQLIIDSLKSGSDFTEFAQRYSQDPGSAKSGGDLGFTRRGQFVKEFEEAAFALSEGQISKPVESPFGIHIIQLIERRGEQVHTRHILLRVEADTTADAEVIALLNRIVDSVKSENNFSDFAKKYSDDVETASIGGYLGKISSDQLQSAFTETVKGLKDGDISSPIKVPTGTTYGYQLIYLKKRIPAHKISLDSDWKTIEAYANNYHRNQEYQKWLGELRKEIFWQVRL
jgi:peptidyl-prolyl cis-trans isomerase SurA